MRPRPFYSRESGTYISVEQSTGVKVALASMSSLRDGDLMGVAKSYLGVPYKWGGTTRAGMDCSGFVRQVFSEARGANLPHQSGAIAQLGKSVSLGKLKEGDILLFGRWGSINHTGIYYKDGTFIHASTTNGVEVASLSDPYYKKHLKLARRL